VSARTHTRAGREGCHPAWVLHLARRSFSAMHEHSPRRINERRRIEKLEVLLMPMSERESGRERERERERVLCRSNGREEDRD